MCVALQRLSSFVRDQKKLRHNDDCAESPASPHTPPQPPCDASCATTAEVADESTDDDCQIVSVHSDRDVDNEDTEYEPDEDDDDNSFDITESQMMVESAQLIVISDSGDETEIAHEVSIS